MLYIAEHQDLSREELTDTKLAELIKKWLLEEEFNVESVTPLP